MSLSHYKLDRSYGSGVYRRLVRLKATERHALATVNDTHHAMWLLLHLDRPVIVDVEAAIERGPATTCVSAPAPLTTLVGLDLRAPADEIAARLPPSANCTHLADLARWSVRYARFRGGQAEYAIAIPDALEAPVWIDVSRNGQLVHRWQVQGETILAPTAYAGKPLLRGFMRWASAAFDGDELEAAIMLQRGVWVARGRRYIVDQTIVPLRAATGMRDACFSYSGANWGRAMNNLGYVRDFTHGVIEHPLPGNVQAIIQEDEHGTA